MTGNSDNPGHIKYRYPWFLSNDNGDETWCITDGVETFPIHLASPTEFGLAVKGTIERATAAHDAALAEKVRRETVEEVEKIIDRESSFRYADAELTPYGLGAKGAAAKIPADLRTLTTTPQERSKP